MGFVCGVLVVTVIEITIVGVYLQLCAEGYAWHWRSFLLGASSALYIFAYIVYYFCTKLHISGFVSAMLFFAYGALASALYGLLMGTVGVLAAWTFVESIYASVKVD